MRPAMGNPASLLTIVRRPRESGALRDGLIRGNKALVRIVLQIRMRGHIILKMGKRYLNQRIDN